MAEIADAFSQWMRDYVTDGVPASGVNPPSKAEGRAIGALIEAYVADLITAASITTPVGPSGPFVMPAYGTAGAVAPGLDSCNAAWPSVSAGDIAILMVSTDQWLNPTVPDPVRPTGFTQIGSIITEGAIKAALYWRRCDGTESGSVTVTTTTGSAASRIAAVIATFGGCVDNGDPYEAVDTNHGPGPSMPSRAVTTTGAERLIVNFFMPVNGGSASLSGPDTGFTEVLSTYYTTQHDQRFIIDVQAAAVAGTSGIDTRTLTSNHGWACFSLALLPSS